MAAPLLVVALVLAAVAGASGPRRTPAGTGFAHFRSRPDLRPPRVVTVTTPAAGTAAGLVFLAPKNTGGQEGPLIVDDTGDVVWFDPGRHGEVSDFRVQRYRGQPGLTWWEGTSRGGNGAGTEVIMDGSYRQVARIAAGNGYQGDLHEFRITPQGTALITAYRTERRDLRAVGGPRDGYVLDGVAQEVDIATGRVLFQWRAVDHVPRSRRALFADARAG